MLEVRISHNDAVVPFEEERMFLDSLRGFLLYYPVLVAKDTVIAETFVISAVIGFYQRSIKYRYVETCPMWVRGTLVDTER